MMNLKIQLSSSMFQVEEKHALSGLVGPAKGELGLSPSALDSTITATSKPHANMGGGSHNCGRDHKFSRLAIYARI